MTRPRNYRAMDADERRAWDRQEREREDLEYEVQRERQAREDADYAASRRASALREEADGWAHEADSLRDEVSRLERFLAQHG